MNAVSQNAAASSVEVDGMGTAVCYVGRDKKGDRVDILVFSEEACDALKGRILDDPPDQVHSRAPGQF